MGIGWTLRDNDWNKLRQILQQIASLRFGYDAIPTFGGLNIEGSVSVSGTLTLSGLTATRLMATDASKNVVSAIISDWLAGTTNQVTVTNDGDGTATLSLPQNIHTGASPTFAGLNLSTNSVLTWVGAVGDPSITLTHGAAKLTFAGMTNLDLGQSTLSVTGNLETEKLTNGTFTNDATKWTLGVGWQYISTVMRKNSDGTGTLSQTSANMATPLVVGEWYTLSYVISFWTVGTVTPSIAGVTLDTVGANGTYTRTFQAASTADLVFTPTHTARFFIDNISLKKQNGLIKGGSLWMDGTSGATPTSGAGTRLMWIPNQGAFRAGRVVGTQWNSANIGLFSVAFGDSGVASAYCATHFGDSGVASAYGATHFGSAGVASGYHATHFGSEGVASGNYATHFGEIGVASGSASTHIGVAGVVSGDGSTHIGISGVASGYGAFIAGVNDNFNSSSFIAGTGTPNIGYGQIVIGYASLGKTMKAEGSGSVAIGQDVNALTNANILVFGKDFTATTASSFNVGFGQRDFQVTSGNAKFGSGAAGVDFAITFDGETTDGVLTWMEDEDYFQFSDDIFIGTEKLFFNGTDTSIYESGDDVHIDTPANKTLVLDEVVYNDANVGGMALRAGVTSPPITQWVDNAGNNTGIYGLGFAVNDEANGSIEIPHDYKEETDLVFHVHWGSNAAPTGTDYVKWTLTYSVTRGGTTFPAATAISVETAHDTQYKLLRSDFAAITGTNFKIGDQFNFNLKRVAAAGDAYAGVAILETIGFHYQCDTLGSRQIGTK